MRAPVAARIQTHRNGTHTHVAKPCGQTICTCANLLGHLRLSRQIREHEQRRRLLLDVKVGHACLEAFQERAEPLLDLFAHLNQIKLTCPRESLLDLEDGTYYVQAELVLYDEYTRANLPPVSLPTTCVVSLDSRPTAPPPHRAGG